MVQFDVQFDIANSPNYGQLTAVERQQILDAVNAAATWWARYLAPVAVTLDVDILVDDSLFEAGALAFADSDFSPTGSLDEGVPVVEETSVTKIRAGIDPNGAEADFVIGLSASVLRDFFYFRSDPLAITKDVPVPPDRVDALSIFLHEVGHGIGIAAVSNTITDPSFSQQRSTFETFVALDHLGLPAFFGPNAMEAAHSSSGVALEPGSISHLSETYETGDLMSPEIPPGALSVVPISRIDVGILKDLGLPIRVPTDGNDVIYGLYGGTDGTVDLGAGDDITYSFGGFWVGGLGNDKFYGPGYFFGGLGNDQFNIHYGVLEYASNVSGGGGTDVVVVSGQRSEYALGTVFGTGIQLTKFGHGPVAELYAVERLVFDDQTVSLRLAPAADFSGEGTGDLLWQHDSGQAAAWLQNGFASTAQGLIGAVPSAGWKVIGSGDFDGDGKSDILWQNTATLQAAVWTLDGLGVTAGAIVGNTPSTGWKVVSAGDFDGDGKSDILWQNTSTNQAALWLMNGFNAVNGNIVGNAPSAGWKVIGAGDFNGDGKSDILWQNTATLQAAVWLMNGLSLVSGNIVGSTPSTGWVVKGSGDFDGDGKSDILWQNTVTLQAAAWLMDGLGLVSGNVVGGVPSAGWNVTGAADYDGDGRSDILWQNTNGQAAIWLMNGLGVASANIVGNNPGTQWHLIGQAG